MYLEIIISGGFRRISRFFGNFAVFRGNTWIPRVHNRAKYQKPCMLCCTTTWNNSVDLPRDPSVVTYICITAWIFDSLNCWCNQRIIILLHVNDLIQVIFAARFICRRQHSNMTTLLFYRKTCDWFFLKIMWFCVPWRFCYHSLIFLDAIAPCVISMKILFHVWNLILFKGQKYH